MCKTQVVRGKIKRTISYRVQPNDSTIGSYEVDVNGLFVVKKHTGSFSILGSEEFYAHYEFVK